MSLKIPHNGIRELSQDQLERIVCECGCNEFETPHIVAAFYDKLKYETLVMKPLTALRCLQCFKYLKLDTEMTQWVTQRLKYDPPKKQLEV